LLPLLDSGKNKNTIVLKIEMRPPKRETKNLVVTFHSEMVRLAE
jgi:hypothetical protein